MINLANIQYNTCIHIHIQCRRKRRLHIYGMVHCVGDQPFCRHFKMARVKPQL